MPDEQATIHILWGPQTELRREPYGERWCYKCRKRLPHDAVLLGDPGPDAFPSVDAWLATTGSWLEPAWVFRCAGCGQDHTEFGS